MNNRHIAFVVAALLAITTAVHGTPPESFRAKGTTYLIGDEESSIPHALSPEPAVIPSEIVWGPPSEDHRVCDFARAGCPQCLAKFTMGSNNWRYGGYYVGGGTPMKGAGRSLDDGTWGWDYAGLLFTKRIALNWTANGRSQGGTGAYKTDGPKLKHE